MEKQTTCLNGKLKEGDLVVSAPGGDYSCLIGRVKGIYYVGTPEHDNMTGNPTDDVLVDFNNDYGEKRIAEIVEQFRDLYDDDEKTYDDITIDEVVMAPSELIRIDLDKVGQDYCNSLMEAEARTAEWCFIELLNYTHSQPKGTVYEVTLLSCVDGDNQSESMEFNTECSAYECASEWFSEMWDKIGRWPAHSGTVRRNDGLLCASGEFTGESQSDFYNIRMNRHRWIKIENPQEDNKDD